MWREIKVLLVDDNEQRKHDMQVLLDFLGEESFNSDTSNWRDVATKNGDASEIVAFIVGTSDKLSLDVLLREINEWDKGMPMIYVGSEELPDDLPDDVRRSIIAQVSMPPSYNKLLDSLHRAQIYREHFAHNRVRGERRPVQLFRSLVGTSR